MKKAFTVIELIFVIVVLGILSAIALPKFEKNREMADISKGRADIAAIRSAILTERQSQLIKGINTYIPKLSSNSTTLFTGDTAPDPDRKLLTYGIVAGTGTGKWSANDNTYKLYTFKTANADVVFTYDSANGTFTCVRGDDTDAKKICKQLTD